MNDGIADTFVSHGQGSSQARLPVMRRQPPCVSSLTSDTEQHTREQIDKARSHPWIAKEVPVGGVVFDVVTGLMREVLKIALRTTA